MKNGALKLAAAAGIDRGGAAGCGTNRIRAVAAVS